jgi:RimJ/RimL family protein N-acetyltransferase
VRARIDWTTEAGSLSAIEPTPEDVAAHAAALAAGYNHPANAALLGHTEPIAPAEVIAIYTEMIEGGARAFLLFAHGELAGDGDLRGVHDGAAEFAFMIGAPAEQGQGLGTRFATMIHVFGFRALGLDRVYASIVPHNTASRRVFEKLGYRRDDTPAARAYADDPGDVVMAVERATFERVQAIALDQIRIAMG